MTSVYLRLDLEKDRIFRCFFNSLKKKKKKKGGGLKKRKRAGMLNMFFFLLRLKQMRKTLKDLHVFFLYVYRAADWKLDAPDWVGRLRIVAKGNNVLIKLEDKAGNY